MWSRLDFELVFVVYSQLDKSEGDDREMRVNRCDVLCGGSDHWRVCFSVRPTHRVYEYSYWYIFDRNDLQL